MRQYYVRNEGRMEKTDRPDQAEWVMIDTEELGALERKLKNKTEEAERWRRRLTGEDQEYKIITVDYIDNNHPIVYITVLLPLAFQLTKEIKNEAKSLVESKFNQYISGSRRYKLHFAPKSGWSVNLQLTEEELESFQLPN